MLLLLLMLLLMLLIGVLVPAATAVKYPRESIGIFKSQTLSSALLRLARAQRAADVCACRITSRNDKTARLLVMLALLTLDPLVFDACRVFVTKKVKERAARSWDVRRVARRPICVLRRAAIKLPTKTSPSPKIRYNFFKSVRPADTPKPRHIPLKPCTHSAAAHHERRRIPGRCNLRDQSQFKTELFLLKFGFIPS